LAVRRPGGDAGAASGSSEGPTKHVNVGTVRVGDRDGVGAALEGDSATVGRPLRICPVGDLRQTRAIGTDGEELLTGGTQASEDQQASIGRPGGTDVDA